MFKVWFHYRTTVAEEGLVLDDSKKLNEKKPMELIIGKKFKLEVWEKSLRTMWEKEVSQFTVVKELLFDYPVVAKQLREYYARKCGHKPSEDHKPHCCGFNLFEHGVGHADLDELLRNPKALEFVLEVVKVEQPGEYEKETWALSEEEKIARVPVLKEEGNAFFKEKNYEAATKKYQDAIGILEQSMLRERSGDPEWHELNAIKLPILLNYSLCKFHLKDFYSVIEHTSTVLEHQPDNTKALFRRGKAHAAIWNMNEAEMDLKKCKEVDTSLSSEVDAQLSLLDQNRAQKDKEERKMFKGKLFV